jgi:hypothetical protein
MDSKRLPIVREVQKLINPEPEREAPLPQLWGVLYVDPLAGSSARRNCKNCFMWVSTEQKCVIHPKELKVTGLMICGYHVGGVPMKKWMDIPGLASVSPKYSGLGGEVPEGTACDNCKFFEGTEEEAGVCHGAQKKNHPAPVHPRGCCSRWEEKTDE